MADSSIKTQSTAIAQMHKDLTDLVGTTLPGKRGLPRRVVKIIPSYEITSQVEINKSIWSGYSTDCLSEPSACVKIGLRDGRYKNLPVTYKTFVTDPTSTAQEVSERHTVISERIYRT